MWIRTCDFHLGEICFCGVFRIRGLLIQAPQALGTQLQDFLLLDPQMFRSSDG